MEKGGETMRWWSCKKVCEGEMIPETNGMSLTSSGFVSAVHLAQSNREVAKLRRRLDELSVCRIKA